MLFGHFVLRVQLLIIVNWYSLRIKAPRINLVRSVPEVKVMKLRFATATVGLAIALSVFGCRRRRRKNSANPFAVRND